MCVQSDEGELTAVAEVCYGSHMDTELIADPVPKCNALGDKEKVTETEGRCRWAAIADEPSTATVLWTRIAEGETLRGIAASWAVPVGRMLAWVMHDEDRYAAYRKATEVAAHVLMSEVIAIADQDGPDLGRDKLRIETRFKVAAAHAKDRYGVQAAHGGSTNVQVIVQRHGPPAGEAG